MIYAPVELYTLLIVLSGVVWLTTAWRMDVGRWFTVVAASGLVYIGAAWMDIPALVGLLVLSVALAGALIGLAPAAIVAASNTVLLAILFTAGAWSRLEPATTWVTIAALWGVLGILAMAAQPIYGIRQWLEDSATEAREAIEEARNQTAEMERTFDALAHVNRELSLQSERMAAMRSAVEDAQRAKADFAAIISHEFRTPLNMIIGLMDTLAETPERYAQAIPRCCWKTWRSCIAIASIWPAWSTMCSTSARRKAAV